MTGALQQVHLRFNNAAGQPTAVRLRVTDAAGTYYAPFGRLTQFATAPGIGRILGPIILLETGPIERFASVGNYASYARLVDSERISNEKKKGEGNRRNGNKYLAWAFIEAANMAKRWCPEAKRFYERKKARTNAVVATKALAHKLARACYHMLKTARPFDMRRCFG